MKGFFIMRRKLFFIEVLAKIIEYAIKANEDRGVVFLTLGIYSTGEENWRQEFCDYIHTLSYERLLKALAVAHIGMLTADEYFENYIGCTHQEILSDAENTVVYAGYDSKEKLEQYFINNWHIHYHLMDGRDRLELLSGGAELSYDYHYGY